MALPVDPKKGVGELESQVAVMRRSLEPDEEGPNVDAERAGDVVEPTGGDPVGADLVSVKLLAGHPDQRRQLILRQPDGDPALAKPSTDMTIDLAKSHACPDPLTCGNVAGSQSAILRLWRQGSAFERCRRSGNVQRLHQ